MTVINSINTQTQLHGQLMLKNTGCIFRGTKNELTQLAEDTGVSVDQILSKTAGEAFNAQELFVARSFHAAAAENLHSLAIAATKSGADVDKKAFMDGF